ncbi:MAG: hypothetical protein N2258_07805 [Brevinematales bacterium]|nr:hypothetical protein [Brevinematales bacterium]
MRKILVFLFILLSVCLFAEDEESPRERFLFVAFDTGQMIKALFSGGGYGVGGQIEFANFKYVGIAANAGYFNAGDNSFHIELTSFGGGLVFYPEGYGPYGYYIKVGCLYNSGIISTNGVGMSGNLITIPINLGMKFIFDDLWGLTLDPYLEGEIYIGLDGVYKNVLTVKQAVGFRFGFTF